MQQKSAVTMANTYPITPQRNTTRYKTLNKRQECTHDTIYRKQLDHSPGTHKLVTQGMHSRSKGKRDQQSQILGNRVWIHVH